MPAQLIRTGNVLRESYFREETFEFVQNKIKTLQAVNVTTPEQVDREITEAEKNAMYKNYRPGRLLDIENACDEVTSCFYTITPDSNFVIDLSRTAAGPYCFSVFKPWAQHSGAVGEVLAELVLEGKSRIDISRIGIARFPRPIYRR